MDDELAERAAAMRAAEMIAGGAAALGMGITILHKGGSPTETIRQAYEDSLQRAAVIERGRKRSHKRPPRGSGESRLLAGINILRKLGVSSETVRKIFDDALERAESGLRFPPIDAFLVEFLAAQGFNPTPKLRDEDHDRLPAAERDKILASRRKAARSDFRKATRAFDELAESDPEVAEQARFRYLSVMAEALKAVLKP